MALNQAPIRVFNSALDFRAEISLYESAYFQRLDYGIGEFQIQVNLNIPYVNEFVPGAFVQFDYDVKKIGIIIEITKRIGERGKGDQVLVVKGREAKYIFTQRLIIPPVNLDTYQATDNAERALKELIDFQAGPGCPDANRELTDFVIDADQNRGIAYYLNERNSLLSDVLEKICLACEMGYYVYLDPVAKKLRLEVNFGTDHTAEQTTNGQVLFSIERNTIRKGEITESMATYKNACYVAGDGQGKGRNIRLVYSGATEPTGWDRRETLLDVKQVNANTDIDAAGARRLNETQYTTFANGQFLNYSTYVYGVNFDLGDYVTIKIYDVQQNVKITGVRESWSKGKYEIDFDYDKSYPQFNQTVTARINGIQGILNNTEPVIHRQNTITSNTTIDGLYGDCTLFASGGANGIVLTLTPKEGQRIKIYKTDLYSTNKSAVTIKTAYAINNFTVQGGNYYLWLFEQQQWIELYFNGTQFFIVGGWLDYSTGGINRSAWQNVHMGDAVVGYDNVTTAFTIGEKVTAASGNTGVIVFLDSTTMILKKVTGTGIFINNESLTGSFGGVALENVATKNVDSYVWHNTGLAHSGIQADMYYFGGATYNKTTSRKFGNVAFSDNTSASLTINFMKWGVDENNFYFQTGDSFIAITLTNGTIGKIDTDDHSYMIEVKLTF